MLLLMKDKFSERKRYIWSPWKISHIVLQHVVESTCHHLVGGEG